MHASKQQINNEKLDEMYKTIRNTNAAVKAITKYLNINLSPTPMIAPTVGFPTNAQGVQVLNKDSVISTIVDHLPAQRRPVQGDTVINRSKRKGGTSGSGGNLSEIDADSAKAIATMTADSWTTTAETRRSAEASATYEQLIAVAKTATAKAAKLQVTTPRRQMKVLPLSAQISRMRNGPNDTDLYIGVYVDGFSATSRPDHSLVLVHIVVLNFPSTLRYKNSYMLQYTVFPGSTSPKKKNIWTFMRPLLHELYALEHHGIEVLCDDDIVRSSKVLNFYITGDLPGVAPFAGHAGHTSHYPCRICCVRGDDAEGTGRPGRYVGALKEAPLRTREDFENGTENGLLPLNPLVPLCTFTGPMFFALEELHLIGHGICKHLYRLFIGRYDVKGATMKYSLGSGAWNVVANDLSSNSIDYKAFENVFRLPAKQRSHRAVDWIGLLSFIFPALIISRMHMDCIDPTIAIITFIQYTQQHELTYDDLDIMDNCLHTFNLFVANAIHNNTIHVSFLTPTVHYLKHITHTIRALGPPRYYSTRCMERTVGVLKKSIRSTTEPGVNAMNVLTDRSALAYLDRLGVLEGVLGGLDGGEGNVGGEEDDEDYEDYEDNEDDNSSNNVKYAGIQQSLKFCQLPIDRQKLMAMIYSKSPSFNFTERLNVALAVKCHADLYGSTMKIKAQSYCLVFNIPRFGSSTNEQVFADVLFYITISDTIYAVAMVNEVNQDSQNLMLCTSTDQLHQYALLPAVYIQQRLSTFTNSETAKRYYFWHGMVCGEAVLNEFQWLYVE
ncbi:hypothetical protein [Absidia glauca]|uniref:Uncharacterized protein n=1 Tax=Absidia glauca TaxID=4829 RepID=A0A163KCD0_ABSGL|nr:hypothetical protein [Absidia glauca]